MVFCNNLHKHYGPLHVVKGVNLSIEAGEILSIIGESGAGKSTLLQILGTLDKADEGDVSIDGVNLSTLKGKALAHFRNTSLGFVFQFHQLLPEFTALENAMMPGLIAGLSTKAAEKRAGELLNYLGLGDRHHHKPGQLSGGEQQRVSIARALANRPPVILADEPTAPLDSERALGVMRILNAMAKQSNTAIIVVTHDEKIIPTFKRIYHIRDGVTHEEVGEGRSIGESAVQVEVKT